MPACCPARVFCEVCSAFPGAGDCEAYVGTAALRALRGGACVALFINAGGGDHDCDGINIHSFMIFRLIPIDTPADTRAVLPATVITCERRERRSGGWLEARRLARLKHTTFFEWDGDLKLLGRNSECHRLR